jgi:hypothetical protein
MQKKLIDLFGQVCSRDDETESKECEKEKSTEQKEEQKIEVKVVKPKVIAVEEKKTEAPTQPAIKEPYIPLKMHDDKRMKFAEVADCIYRKGHVCIKKEKRISLDCRKSAHGASEDGIACWERMTCEDYRVEEEG